MKSSRTIDGPQSTRVHYIVIGPREGLLCCSAQDRSKLCKCIVAATASSADPIKATLLAYCIDDRWLRMVLSSASRVISGPFIRSLFGTDRPLLELSGAPSSMLEVVRSVELPSLVSQLAAVRHCHFAPVELGLVGEPAAWPWTTHRLYLGLQKIAGFTRNWLSKQLAQGHGGWQLAYARLMSTPEEGETSVGLSHCTVPILPLSRADGDRACLRALKRLLVDDDGERTEDLERLFRSSVRRVCRTTGCDVRAFRKNPAASRFRLVRALLVDRLVVNRKILSMSQLSARLRCDRSWLYKTRAQCRREYPGLFTQTAGTHDLEAPSPLEADLSPEASLLKWKRGKERDEP